jgi:hypothetical protein
VKVALGVRVGLGRKTVAVRVVIDVVVGNEVTVGDK